MTLMRNIGLPMTVADILDCLQHIKPSVGAVRVALHEDCSVSENGTATLRAGSRLYDVSTDEPVPESVQDTLAYQVPFGTALRFKDSRGNQRIARVSAYPSAASGEFDGVMRISAALSADQKAALIAACEKMRGPARLTLLPVKEEALAKLYDVLHEVSDQELAALGLQRVVVEDTKPADERDPVTRRVDEVTRVSPYVSSIRNLAGRVSECMTTEDPKPADERDPVTRRVDEVIDDLNARRVAPQSRERLGRALDKADAPLAGREGQDEALGRAIGRH